MANIKYYKDIDHDFLFAYEKSTEFFVIFDDSLNEWKNCNISFKNFIHDYYFEEIKKEDAIKITSGNLPEIMFEQYLDMIRKNLDCNLINK